MGLLQFYYEGLHTHSMGLEPITSPSIPLLREEEMPVEP